MTCLFGLWLDGTLNPVTGTHMAWVGHCLDVSVKQIEEVSPPHNPRITMSHLQGCRSLCWNRCLCIEAQGGMYLLVPALLALEGGCMAVCTAFGTQLETRTGSSGAHIRTGTEAPEVQLCFQASVSEHHDGQHGNFAEAQLLHDCSHCLSF
jgi:hypothetical protein